MACIYELAVPTLHRSPTSIISIFLPVVFFSTIQANPSSFASISCYTFSRAIYHPSGEHSCLKNLPWTLVCQNLESEAGGGRLWYDAKAAVAGDISIVSTQTGTCWAVECAVDSRRVSFPRDCRIGLKRVDDQILSL